MIILNLDKISKKSGRVLLLDGVKHEVLPVSVGGFLNINDMAKTMADAEPADQLKTIVDSIVAQVPSVTRERLMELDLDTVNVIASYVRGEDVEQQEQELQAAAEAAGK